MTINKNVLSGDTGGEIPRAAVPDTKAAARSFRSELWPILSIAAFLLALAENLLIPDVQDVKPFPYRIVLVGLAVFFFIRYLVSFWNENTRKKVVYKAPFYFACGVFLMVWDFFSAKTGILPLPFLPGPSQIAQVTVQDSKLLLISTGYSLRLFFVGFLAGTFLGLITGVLIGWYHLWEYWLFPVVKITGVIPAVAWIPLFMIIFPSSFIAGTFLIVICVWFPVAFMTSSGIKGINKSYFEAAKTLGAGEWFLVFKIALPGSVPSIFTGISTATALSFTTLVVSEMIGAKAGLGWYINWAKGWSIYSKVYAAIIIMAIVFSIILAVIGKIRDRLLIWQKGLVK